MSIQNDIRFAFQKTNNTHVQFVLINVGVFLLMNTLNVISNVSQTDIFKLVSFYTFNIPANIDEFLFRPWTIITYAFAQVGFFHLLSNMMFLYFVGGVFVDFLGDRRFINLYILGGISGAILYLISYNLIPYYIDRTPGLGMIGASAAVNAIVVGAATLSPNYSFRLFIIGDIKIKYIALFLVVVSFLQVDGGNAGGNIAHLGGAAMGYFFVVMLQKGTDLGRPLNVIYEFIGGLINPSKRVKVTYKKESNSNSTSAVKTTSKTSQDEIDYILDKIAESGYESLSKQEKDKLFNASRD